MARFTADNTSGAMAAFKLRKYSKYIYPSNVPGSLDIVSANRLYGKIDRNDDVCYLVAGGASVRFFENSPTVFAVDFVVRAFEDFQQYYRDTILDGDIPYLGKSEINPVFGWRDFGVMYSRNLAELRDFMVSYYLPEHQRRILNFDDFVEVFCKYFSDTAASIPLTKTAAILHASTPIATTGLVIETDDKDLSDEAHKMRMLSDKNGFRLYTIKLAKFGFFVDENAPWRIVANLASPQMQTYMSRSGVSWSPGSASNYFEKFCLKSHLEDMDELRSFFTSTYGMFVNAYPFRKSTRRCSGSTKTDLASRIEFNPLNPRYDEEYWFRLLLRIRLMETRVTRDFTKEDFESTIKRAMLASSQYNIEKGLNVINTALKSVNSTLNQGISPFSLDKSKETSVLSMNGKSSTEAFNE
mgnify:CR=1 FL=1|jgi:hypothetical protein